MSIGTKTPRLLAAAKEFNIGKETLLAFLEEKGFDTKGFTPASKLSEDMYEALQGRYAKDKAAKQKSEAIDLPKVSLMENLEKNNPGTELPAENKEAELEPGRTTENELVEKEETPPAEQPVEVKLSIEPEEELGHTEAEEKNIEQPINTEAVKDAPPALSKAEETVQFQKDISDNYKEQATVDERTEVDDNQVDTIEPQIEDTPTEVTQSYKDEAEEIKPTQEPEPTETPTEPAETSSFAEEPLEKSEEGNSETVSDDDNPSSKPIHIDTEAPVLEGPKVVTKIDLNQLNLNTRPKKGTGAKKNQNQGNKQKDAPSQANRNQEKPKHEFKEKQASQVTPTGTNSRKLIFPTSAGTPPVEAEKQLEHIETKTVKLEGPKILGKIELPTPVERSKNDAKNKRKRKRIPVDKKHGNAKPGLGLTQKDPNPKWKPQPHHGNVNNTNDRRNRRPQNDQPAEIDTREIQEKIKETQAKLAGGGSKNKNLKAKYRRNKREERAEKRAAEERENSEKRISVTEYISVSELANLLDVSFADVISKCMSLGIMVSINQRLDAEIIELVASEFDTEVEFINLEDQAEEELEEVDAEEDLQPRAPVVTIMGHVDHGKTSLLDNIRNTRVVAGEAGGITQHIGAYQVTMEDGKKITFLDTPGHEAFTAMRARGAKAADVAIIVIAADDAVMPQTREAISHAQAAQLPMVFAINKIDKDGANPERIKEQLSAMNILVEDWGGTYQSQEISAKKGINIDELLEKVLLEAELLDLKANPDKEGVGTVIEASLDKGKGYVSTVLVQAGTLQQGDMVVAGQYFGKVKAMANERGQKVKKVGPSTPVQLLGLNGAPQAGEKFKVYYDEAEGRTVANNRARILREQGLRSRKHITLDEIGRRLALGNFKELNVIIKADVDGSAEALSDSLQKLSTEEIVVNVVLKGVGQISESDVMLASASDAVIIGFQVRPSAHAAKLAEQENIEIRHYSIIYDAIDEIKSAMEGMLEPKVEKKIVGNVEVREIFHISKIGTIAGCYVTDGKISRNTMINVIRDGIVIRTTELASLKRFKDDVKDVSAGYECGLSLKGSNDIEVGDILEGYEEVAVKRTL